MAHGPLKRNSRKTRKIEKEEKEEKEKKRIERKKRIQQADDDQLAQSNLRLILVSKYSDHAIPLFCSNLINVGFSFNESKMWGSFCG